MKKFIWGKMNDYVQDKNEIMSMRCKVCNTSKISNVGIVNSNSSWECQNCGNILDANGRIATVK
jgi:transcription elongation factor Elf1